MSLSAPSSALMPMPGRPRFTSLRHLPLLYSGLLLLSLSACVTTGGPSQRNPAPQDNSALQLNQIARILPGRYGNFQQVHQQSRSGEERKIPPLNLQIQASADLTESIEYLVEQSTPGQSESTRAFLWRLVATNGRLILRVLPRDRAGARPCDIPLQPTATGYAGQSDPRQCAVDNPSQAQLGVRKEIAITAAGLTLADQVIDLLSGQTRFQSIVEFQRISEFKGWAGVKDEQGQWRLARAFALHNDGDQISLIDAQGQPLGIRLQLARVNYREDRPAILRLAVYRENSDEAGSLGGAEMLAYSWAETTASQIGLNLEWFQAGLELHRPEGR